MTLEKATRPARFRLRGRIAELVVRAAREVTGHGPQRVEVFRDGALLACVMDRPGTPAERSLLAAGERETALEMRRRFNALLLTRLGDEIAATVGEPLVAAFSDHDIEAERTLFAFQFAAAPEEPESG
jgi:uncharacterized protein YbcI